MRKINLLSKDRLFDAASTMSELCARMHDCNKCSLQPKCLKYFQNKLTGNGQPTEADTWGFLEMLVMSNNGGEH